MKEEKVKSREVVSCFEKSDKEKLKLDTYWSVD